MSPEELHEAITAIQRAKLSRRAISRQGHANQKAKKLKNREEIIEAAYADAKQRNITDANEVIHPIDYLLWQEPWWVEGRDADEVWKGMSLSSTDQARFRGLDHVTRRGVHIGPLGPDQLQELPNGAGELDNLSLGPNRVLSVETLAEIPHCTPGRESNMDFRAWAGGFGAMRSIRWWNGHNWSTYSFDGNVYYMYGFGYDNDLLVRGNQYQMAGVLPQHAGLCELNCSAFSKVGPFMRYDWCVSFETNESGDPSTFRYRLLRVKDTAGTMNDVDFDLELCKEKLAEEGLTATPGGFVYDPK